MGLNKGRLIYDVTIQELTESTGDEGFPVDTWAPLASRIWMSREAQTGMERFAAAQLSASTTTRWQMPYRADMDPDLVDVQKKRRLLYQNRAYGIVSASPIGRNDGIELVTLAGEVV